MSYNFVWMILLISVTNVDIGPQGAPRNHNAFNQFWPNFGLDLRTVAQQ